MPIQHIRINPFEVLEFSGRIDANNCAQAEEAFEACIAQGGTKIIADMGGLDYISSAGLRVFLAAIKKTAPDGFVHLCNLQPQVAQIFEITGFNSIFRIFPGRDEAIANS